MNAQDPFDPAGGPAEPQLQGIANAIGDVSERAVQLIHEEIELAKAEVSEKASKLVRGAIVAAAAGIFVVTALFFVLVGLALLAYYYLPDSQEYFWGFFVVAGGLIVLAALAGLIAARAVKAGSPPTPSMAMDEARKIRESVSAGPTTPSGTAAVGSAPFADAAFDPAASQAASAYGPLGGSPAPPVGAEGIPGWDPVPASSPVANVPVPEEPVPGEESRG